MYRSQRLGKSRVGEPGEHAGCDAAARDDMMHDQDQEIIEQPVERCLAAAASENASPIKRSQTGRQRRMRCERQNDEFGQALPDRVVRWEICRP